MKITLVLLTLMLLTLLPMFARIHQAATLLP
jgi:hypothetical protein